MAIVKTAISLQESLFEQIEAVAEEMQISRSRFFALAAESFIQTLSSSRVRQILAGLQLLLEPRQLTD